MNLSEHFTLDEATYSETAVRMGISNQPSAAQLENMKAAANVKTDKKAEKNDYTESLRRAAGLV